MPTSYFLTFPSLPIFILCLILQCYRTPAGSSLWLPPSSGVVSAVVLLASGVCVLSGAESQARLLPYSRRLLYISARVFLTTGISCQSLSLDLPPTSLPLLCVQSSSCASLSCQCQHPHPCTGRRPTIVRRSSAFLSHECPCSAAVFSSVTSVLCCRGHLPYHLWKFSVLFCCFAKAVLIMVSRCVQYGGRGPS